MLTFKHAKKGDMAEKAVMMALIILAALAAFGFLGAQIAGTVTGVGGAI